MGRGFAIALIVLVCGCERYRVNIPEECANGACDVTCDAGLTQCAGDCVNIANDPRHCGGCDSECPAENYCVAGVCSFGCGAPNGVCPTAQGYEECIDVTTSITNCGGCSFEDPTRTCTANSEYGTVPVCNSGTCGWNCQPGLFACGDLPSDVNGEPMCAPRDSDNCFCGGCDTSCRSWSFDATSASCTSAGLVGEACCGGGCVTLDADTSCGTSCADYTNCTRNVANTSCCPGSATGYRCVDERRDEANCGGCGVTCGTAPATSCCGGECVDVATDIRHCGDCDIACGGTTPACCAGGGAGGRSCQDLSDDTDNCGACGNACDCGLIGLPVCSNGVCSCLG